MWTAAVVVGIATWSAHGFHHGVRSALEVLLAWATTRELAPKRAWPSLLAPILVIPFAIPNHTDLVACAVVLLAARITARTVGDPPTLFDCAIVSALGIWAAHRLAGLPTAVVLSATLFASAPPRRLRIGGAVALLATLAVGSLEGTTTFRPAWDAPNSAEQVLLALAALSALVLVLRPLPRRLAVRDDRRREHLHGSRIHAARIVVVVSVAAVVAWTGTDGAFALSTACAALLATAAGGARQRSGTISP